MLRCDVSRAQGWWSTAQRRLDLDVLEPTGGDEGIHASVGEGVIAAIHGRSGRVEASVVPVKLAATVPSLLTPG